jgi:ferredoxin-type protein NapH
MLAGQVHSMTWFQGSPTGARWFGLLPFVDPLAALEVGLASGRLSTTVLLGATACILIGLLLGRVFCGWLCPLGLLLEWNGELRYRMQPALKGTAFALPSWTLSRSVGFLLLLICLSISLLSSVPVFTMFSPINLLVVTPGSMPVFGLTLVFSLFVLEWFVPRGFCRAICPLGALYSLLGRWAILRVHVVGPERLACRQCSLRCPMGIAVMEEYVQAGARSVDDPHCTRCGTCTDVCLGQILRLGFRPARRRPS